MQKTLFSMLCFLAFGQLANAQCNPGEIKIRIEIDPDEYFEELYIGVLDPILQEPFAFETLTADEFATFEFCVPEDLKCAQVFVFDDGGDGMIGPNGDHGWVKFYANDILIGENLTGEFSNFFLVDFNCPPGGSCSTAFDAGLGLDTIADGAQSWYRFEPQVTGAYKFDACDLGNTCPVKFWLYKTCGGYLTDNQAGALFYADGNCANGASATVYLAGGETYYFRTKYKYGSCTGQPLVFNLSFEGPIKGCTDPTACNYQPLATIADTCIYAGPACDKLPDLLTDEGLLKSSFYLTTEYNADQCAIDEGCLRGFGDRVLLNFTTRIANIGDEDYYIGETPASPNLLTDQFVWDICHQHWHYRGYAEYVLFSADGKRIPIGSKNGFCVLDLECPADKSPKYSCENMGITAGCADVYDAGLPCQWIDVTDLPAGAYTFVVRVNWDKTPDKNGRPEKNYDNNWAQTCFVLTYGADNEPQIEVVDQCPSYTDCVGTVFGDAQPDCEGNCNGKALLGDWNKDTLRNDTDIDAYLQAAVATTGTATDCNDLNADGQIHVFDAALLQECTLHANEPQHWGSRYPCNFPTGLVNPDDIVVVQLGTLDKVAKTLTVNFFNPNQRLFGYQMRVAGLEIESIENIDPQFVADIRFDKSTGTIVALTKNEAFIKKHNSSVPVFRIHYSKLTATEACLAELTAVVNQRYQMSNASIGAAACLPTGIVATNEPVQNAYSMSAHPNPFAARTDVYFENPENAPVDIILTDLNGRAVRKHEQVRTDGFSIERGELPTGIYFLTLRGAKGVEIVKLVIQ